MIHFPLAALALVALVTSTSCSVGGGGSDPVESAATPPADQPTSKGDPTADAVADLAAHTGVDPADVQVVLQEDVTWRNGALGCAKPGSSYVQMLVEGYRIVLRAGGREYVYHGAHGKPPFRCDLPDPNGAVGRAGQ